MKLSVWFLIAASAIAASSRPDGATDLMLAAAAGDVDAIKTALDSGAAIDAREPAHGETALMFAAGSNRAAAIRLLAARGADLKATTTVVKMERMRSDEDGGKRADGLGGQARGTSATVMGGMTALLLASRNGYVDSVQALLDAGADVNQVSAGDGSSPLVIAICNGHYDLAKVLLDRGANPNLATIDGLAALYATEDTEFAQVGWAPNPITSQEKTGYLELTKALLAHGADPNAPLKKALWFRPTSHNQEWIDKKGATPFWRAAQATDVAAMKILLAGGANPKLASDEGVTPLMVASGLGWGANASRTVPDGWTPAVKYLLSLGADVNAKDKYGYTALHGAAYRGDNDVVRLLAQNGAQVDVRSKRGQTPADMANGPIVNAHLPMPHADTVALLQKLAPPPQVDFELMTWPEVKSALQQGRTTALIFNGGTEQRGPQGVNGAHSLIVRELGREIAAKLGNAILAPVIPYSVNKANAELPGTIGITGPLFAALNEEVAEQMIVNGFRNIVLLGDHGGGQKELAEVAKKLDAKYSSQGIRVVYCNDVYEKVGVDFNKWLADNHYPAGSHASVKDTSELLYLGGDKGWVRKDLISTAVGDASHKNGIQGDARPSTAEIGKRVSDMKVEYAVRQIRQLLNEKSN